MLKISGTGIRLTSGDTARFTIRLGGMELPDGTKTMFTVKKRAWRYEVPQFEVAIPVIGNAVHVMLPPELTNLAAGDYVWDLRVFSGDDVFTPMEYARFHVVEAIGYE